MLLGLSHNAVGSSHNKDCAVHLSSTGDHVLDIVSMSGAVNVRIVSSVSLILHMCGRNGDTTLSLFGSLIDILEIHLLVSGHSLSQNLGDRSRQSCLTMVNVTDGTNVTMGLVSFKFSFSHY